MTKKKNISKKNTKKNSKKNIKFNKIIKIVFIIIIILIVCIFSVFCALRSKDTTRHIFNDSKTLTKEQCVEDICVKDLKLVEDATGEHILSATLSNKKTNAIINGCIRLVFGNEKIDYCYLEIESNNSIPLEIHLANNSFYKYKSYKLELLKGNELDKVLEEKQVINK